MVRKFSGVWLVLTLGCSTTSTISRVNGPPVEGNIVGGSPDSIFVATDARPEYEIPRDDIAEIDYPGNVHTNVGVGVLAYGALNIGLGLPKCNERVTDKAAYCTGVFLPAAIGAGLIIWGLIVHHGQTAAVADTSRQSRLPPPHPEPDLRLRRAPATVDGAGAPSSQPDAPSSQPDTPSSQPDAPSSQDMKP